jgi:hypothetical protein
MFSHASTRNAKCEDEMRYDVCANDVGKLMKNYHKYVLVYLGLVKVWPLDFNCMKFSRFHHAVVGD